MEENNLAALNLNPSQLDGNSAFLEDLARYYMDFLETDFHKRSAPKRSVKLRDGKGQLTGVNLRKYDSFRDYIWSLFTESIDLGNQFVVSRGKYKSRIKTTLKAFIDNSIEDIGTNEISEVIGNFLNDLKKLKNENYDNWNKFHEDAIESLRRAVLNEIVLPLSTVLEKPLTQEVSFGLETVFELEEELIDLICNDLQTNLDKPLVLYFNQGQTDDLENCFSDLLNKELLHDKLKAFFDGFSASDLYLELNELYENKRLNEKQEFYLYFCDIHYNKKAYPLFYFPINLEKTEDKFVLRFDPHIFVNKKAVEYIVQEYGKEVGKTLSLSSLKNRIIYMKPNEDNMANCLQQLVSDITTHFSLNEAIDLRDEKSKRVKSLLVSITNDIYFCLFDKSDESLINDYEQLIEGLTKGATDPITEAFKELINGYILENPTSYNGEVEEEWENKTVSERLVYEAPIPLNEEQKKIASSLKKADCKFIAVQGPPGTGKSHTITAIAFDAILNNSSVLILSDKQEALDVVEDKIVQTINKVRVSDDFQNPILRLDKRNFGKIFSGPVINKIKEFHRVAKKKQGEIDALITTKSGKLQNDLTDTVNSYKEIQLSDIADLYETENKLLQRLEASRQSSEDKPWSWGLITDLNTLLVFLEEENGKGVFQLFLNIVQEKCQSWTDENVHKIVKLFEVIAELYEEGVLDSISSLSKVDHDTRSKILNSIAAYNNLANQTNNEIINSVIAWVKKNEIAALNTKLNSEVLFARAIDLKADSKLLECITEDLSKAVRAFLETGLSEEEYLSVFLKILSHPHNDDLLTFCDGAVYSLGFFSGLSRESSKQTLKEFGIDLSFEKTNDIDILESYLELSWLLIDDFNKRETITSKFDDIPQIDYTDECSHLEELQTTRMANLIDERVIDFAENNKATAQTLRKIISNKQKFPKDDFETLKQAFPCIIAGIRDYAEYIPLESNLFDLVIIDEASQVSIAQAFPAILRAKKILVLGDNKQFSNVKTSHASNVMNQKYMVGIKECFLKNISSEQSNLVRVDQFNIKTSILEFFDFVSNYDVMLKKHFRGYRELISFSSKYFYDGGLQAIKIRGKPADDILKFTFIEHDEKLELPEHANTNPLEADFIIEQLEEMVKSSSHYSVGVITPHTNQQKFLAQKVANSEYSDEMYEKLKLKVMTFDTCQGEERDIIFYSMVASATSDKTNYIFASDLSKTDDDEKKIRLQRLNVGFSRAKECMHFVLSKPIEDFSGSIGTALKHYRSALENAKQEPTADDVDQNSPMEKRVLEWIKDTPFYQKNANRLELHAQFPVGEYLKQLDHTYEHPRYRCDFLLQHTDEGKCTNIIIEYDGFKEHFTDLKDVSALNYQSYYKDSDVEREKILESYGYKFVRINRFNLGKDPVTTLSNRLENLIIKKDLYLDVTEDIIEKAKKLSTGDAKECPKCGEIKPLVDFRDENLISGMGRNCMGCKEVPHQATSPTNTRNSLMTPELEKLEAPNCPRCNNKMTMRFRRKDGNAFWGCKKFPYCKGTKNI
ncbi:MAG: AAA domain-containing protein [Alphaproteobacteria bacterium]|nr:AAA domain-containing protein [Alphaproteobacteria bacterium]